jgi:hypothetical protein
MSAISKELLSEIIQKEVTNIETTMFGHFDISFKNDYGTEINRYELANKCKEFALSKKIYLMSTPYSKGHWVCSNQGDEPFAEADNEAEAIFKATQHIFDNGRKNEQSKK